MSRYISRTEYETPRKPRELCNYIADVRDAVMNDASERKQARLRRGLYKQYLDELIPLSIYAAIQYDGSDVLVRPLIGNQGYDAVVTTPEGKNIDVIEITSPIDGLKESNNSKLINERGFGETEMYTPGEELITIFERCLASARKKSIRDYMYECHSSILVAVSYPPPFDCHKERYQRLIDDFALDLARIDYLATRVFLVDVTGTVILPVSFTPHERQSTG